VSEQDVSSPSTTIPAAVSPTAVSPTAIAPAAVPLTTAAAISTLHATSTVERGSFCLARCTCGWYGPARRARDRARSDAENHPAD
jgi:hypothetical protein